MFLGLQHQGPSCFCKTWIRVPFRWIASKSSDALEAFGPAKAAVTIRLGYLQARCKGPDEKGDPLTSFLVSLTM